MGSSYGVHFKYQPALDDQLDHQNIRLRPLSLLDSGLYRFNLEIRGQSKSDVGDFMMVTDIRCGLQNQYVDDL